jgi:hypothetical protein
MIGITRAFMLGWLAVLMGCSVAQPSIPQAFEGTSASAGAVTSWIDPAAKSGPLLYVTAKQQVDVYTWPTLGRAGVLKGLQNASGACEDAAGNLWIVETYKQTITEFAHGGTVPIATLHDPGQYPVACAVDKQNGDLAAANGFNYPNDSSIVIFRHAAGTGVVYDDPGLNTLTSVDYGPGGKIYVDGWSGKFVLQSFARKQFKTISIEGATIGHPGGIQYWNNSLTVADAGSTMSPVTIYQVSDSGKVLASTTLTQSSLSYSYQIRHDKVVCACLFNREILVYAYPGGGLPTRIRYSRYGRQPWAAVISPPS